jgi:hypothetical protein
MMELSVMCMCSGHAGAAFGDISEARYQSGAVIRKMMDREAIAR